MPDFIVPSWVRCLIAFGGICEAGVSVHRNYRPGLRAADLVGDVHEHLDILGSGAGIRELSKSTGVIGSVTTNLT